uniref:Uncharacterized protein n=1 Tax=Chenopodium quinoa TaxID=63459 RepID=A0A803LJ78_CHEQI
MQVKKHRINVFNRLENTGAISKSRCQQKRNMKKFELENDVKRIIPSRMKRLDLLEVKTVETLSVKGRTLILIGQKVLTDCEADDRENILATSNHVTVSEENILDGEVDPTEAPKTLEDGGQSTVDDLKELNLGNTDEPRPIYDLDVYGDSMLIIHQLLDEYEVKKEDLKPYHKRSFLGTWSRCLGDEEAAKTIEEAHSGVCGAHQSAIQEELTEEENAKLRLAELEGLDEKRLEAQQSLECYHARLTRAFNKKVRVCSFQVGDTVLAVRRPIIISSKKGNIFSSKWDGPYIVQEVYINGAYKIVDADGLRVGPINGKFLKRYYP